MQPFPTSGKPPLPNYMHGNMSPVSNGSPQSGYQGNPVPTETSILRGSSETGGSTRRVQQGATQQHVQQVPVFRTVQVQERIIEIPQVHIVKEYVPKIEVVERVREVMKIEYRVEERIVEVPQIQYVDKHVEKIETKEIERYVPKIEIVEVPREVFKIEYQVVEKIVEVPEIQYIDKFVEVPQTQEIIKHVPKIEIVEVPIKREVRVPKIEIRQVEEVKEVSVYEVIEVPVEREVRVNVPVPQIQRIERPVPGPVKIVDVDIEVKVPRHVQVPQYIDVPVPREVIKEIPVPRQIPVYRDVEVRVEVEQIVTVPVERRVPIPRTVYKYVEEIKTVEVPYEVTVPEEVEELIEFVHEVQPVLEPVVHTRYEKLPPIREKGKAVYVNGPPSTSSSVPMVAPPPFGATNSGQLPQMTFANIQTPLMQPAMMFNKPQESHPAPQLPLPPRAPLPSTSPDPEITRINADEDEDDVFDDDNNNLFDDHESVPRSEQGDDSPAADRSIPDEGNGSQPISQRD